jgi:putative inorganic carbon (hco3(-)) transporter
VSLLFGIVLTISRSTWIALAVGLVAGVVLKGGISPRGWVGLGVVIVGAIAAAGSQFSTFGTLAGRTNTIDSRWELMEQGLDGFLSNPILGMGLGRFSEEYGQIIHNTPLWIAAELGIVGLVVLIGLLFWFLDRGIAVYRYGGDRLRGLAIGLILANVAMLGFSLSVEALYQRHWWFLFAMIAIAHHVSGRSDRHSTRPRLEYRRP